MAIETNPLKQYFRRPAVYLKLPSGGRYYPPGVINMPEAGELPVFPMTAIDEITARTPDALFNGTAVADLVKSCVPNITNPWAINSIDLDAVLIAIRTASGGNDMEIESECPSCKEISSYGISLVNVLAQLKSADYESELKVNDLTIKFRPLTYKEMNEASLTQFEIQKIFLSLENEKDEEVQKLKQKEAFTQVTETTMRLLTSSIEHINTPTASVTEKEYILDFLKNCDKEMYAKIRDHNINLRSQTEIRPLKIKCVNCSHDYEQTFTLNTSDFFG